MKKFIALFMVAMLAVCCFGVNTFAFMTGEIFFDRFGNEYLMHGETITRAYPDEDPMTFSPIWARAAVSYVDTIEAQDYASNDGNANIIVTAIGSNHPYEFRMNIHSGGSGYGQA